MAGLVLAFALTIGLEWPVLAWSSGQGFRRTGAFCLCLNGATWCPAMAIRVLRPVPVPALEAAIIVVEAMLLASFFQWRAGRALGVSLLMNLTSWLLGAPLLALLVGP
jgi:hypothetical protein